MSATDTKTELSEENIKEFKEKGFTVVPEFFDEEQVQTFKNEADRLLELIINSSLANNRKSRRLELNEHEDGTQSIRVIQPFIDISRVFKSVAVKELPPQIEPLMNDTAVSLDRTSQLNYKQPLPDRIPELDGVSFTGNYPVHSDRPYFEGKAPTPADFVITSLFIDTCTEYNGPLEVWPGTHRQTYEHEKTDLGAFEVPPDHVDHSGGQPIHGQSGTLVLFDARLVHSSEPNSTCGPRRLAIFRHAPENTVETQIQNGSARPGGYGFPKEIVESTYEHEYRRLKRNGEFKDQFTAPEV